MPQIKQLGRVIVPVSDQDAAIAFYTEKLGFSVSADIPFGNGDRWVEVTPPGGGSSIALTRVAWRQHEPDPRTRWWPRAGVR